MVWQRKERKYVHKKELNREATQYLPRSSALKRLQQISSAQRRDYLARVCQLWRGKLGFYYEGTHSLCKSHQQKIRSLERGKQDCDWAAGAKGRLWRGTKSTGIGNQGELQQAARNQTRENCYQYITDFAWRRGRSLPETSSSHRSLDLRWTGRWIGEEYLFVGVEGRILYGRPETPVLLAWKGIRPIFLASDFSLVSFRGIGPFKIWGRTRGGGSSQQRRDDEQHRWLPSHRSNGSHLLPPVVCVCLGIDWRFRHFGCGLWTWC